MPRIYLKIAPHFTLEYRMSLVLLDRDGVINEDSPEYVRCPSDWLPIPGSLDAIARLNRVGYTVAICSNQSGVARGFLTVDDLFAIHETMRVALAGVGGHIDAIFCCTHAPDAGCSCRKPKPGLLMRAMKELNATPEQTTFVGDSLRDMQAALVAQCVPVLVRTGHGAEFESAARDAGVLHVFDDLAAATNWMIDRR
jgi:D-glycero-D-manno-heptose 1,7-bisphosphate phosphatase